MKPYILSLAAEEDLLGIWRYTYETWGFGQAETYFDQPIIIAILHERMDFVRQLKDRL